MIRRKARPFDWAAAAVRRDPKRCRSIGRALLGGLEPKLWRAATRAHLGEGRGLLTQSARAVGEVFARVYRYAFEVLNYSDPARGRAMSRELWEGNFARRERLSVRQVQRYARLLRRAGVLRTHQPPAEGLPDHLRGRARRNAKGQLEQWAYRCWVWQASLPRDTHTRLARWRTRAPRQPAQSPPPG